jgi:hypothetical protein
MTQTETGSAVRHPAASVADGLCTHFPLPAGNRCGSVRLSVADGLRTWFPLQAQAGGDPVSDRAGGRPRPALPRRCAITVSVRRSQPASPELLRRVLDGLHRL